MWVTVMVFILFVIHVYCHRLDFLLHCSGAPVDVYPTILNTDVTFGYRELEGKEGEGFGGTCFPLFG